ncbi:MAG: SiaB family protein kinase [Bacteroidales bacterium]|nr:SiaB family protein kinase [Bacteroidales bacterium]
MLRKSILSYQGPLSFSTIDWLLSEFKMAAQDHDLSFKTYKKMISVLIEALENISKYNDQVRCNGEKASGFCPSLQISVDDSEIEMETSNPVKNKDVNPLKERIDQVNSHDSVALKELYRSIMANGEFTPKGGAGLGFIEMAKTSGSKLEYVFENLEKGYSLYTFRVSMHK